MKTTTCFAVGLSAGIAVMVGPAAWAQSISACDRECLRSTMTTFLHALLEHDAKKVPVAPTVRVTEDAIEKPLANVGLLSTVTRLRGYRQDILDERAGMAGAMVVVEEAGAPVLLVVRLKVVDHEITEIETVATRSRADMHYPTGLNAAATFAAVNAPFAPDAYRYENGQVMAGPDCKFAPGCQNISTQSLAIFERLGDVSTRVIGVDERLGIVWLRMAWGVRQEGGDQLTVWESFKVYDGEIHAVEAFMKILPVELRSGGWN
jgi:hypothetical protein